MTEGGGESGRVHLRPRCSTAEGIPSFFFHLFFSVLFDPKGLFDGEISDCDPAVLQIDSSEGEGREEGRNLDNYRSQGRGEGGEGMHGRISVEARDEGRRQEPRS